MFCVLAVASAARPVAVADKNVAATERGARLPEADSMAVAAVIICEKTTPI